MQRYFQGWRALAFLCVLSCVLAGCASYSNKIRKPRDLLESGQYDLAIVELNQLAQTKDNDELLYLMDLGTAYHRAGQYNEAIKVFLAADKLAEIKDYTSLTQEAATVLLSDEVKPYQGEDFEKLLVNVYLAIDFALLGRREEALVECRKVNHKLDLMISKGQLPYEQNAFAKYLAAMLFESHREFNDAFVDYRQLLKWGYGEYPYLGTSLLRMADRLKASQEFSEYRQKFPQATPFRIGKNEGEIVLIVEQGRIPVKVPHPNFHLLPMFERRHYSSDHVWIRSGDGRLRARSYPLFDIESTAVKELDHRIGLIAAKKISGVVLKEIVADQVEKQTDSKLAGFLTSLVLHATDSADLRSWSTLPAKLHIARLIVPAGKQELALDRVDRSGAEVKSAKVWKDVNVKAGEIVFLHYRTQD